MPGVRESNQRAKRRAPRCGALRVREDWPGFSTGLLLWRKGIGIHANAPCGAFSSSPHRRTGDPMRALRAFFERAQEQKADKQNSKGARLAAS